ncbi:biotin/lipoyl-containing protein [Leisingera aquaemixtae]|uniref:biotin/lipoyl-containing protein n=1 Tax=Leisingera aquaemixtae TaxID=1396826 RepID=UPI001152ACA2|nr:biotin/lipoyl-containing protein [Leisingera aquaemixtae]QDI74564.1 hypothetical protein R2C4_01830 [Leisingera aquaemixtae]
MGLFTMPSLGSDMESGTLAEWLVAPGDTVARGDAVAVVETQKGAIEIECFEAGTVQELKAQPGQVLPVGAPMAVILAAGEAVPEPEAAAAPPPAAPAAPRLPRLLRRLPWRGQGWGPSGRLRRRGCGRRSWGGFGRPQGQRPGRRHRAGGCGSGRRGRHWRTGLPPR